MTTSPSNAASRNKKITILISPTAFKGTLTPGEVAGATAVQFQAAFPHTNIIECPLADGGDGTLDVLFKAFGGRLLKTRVRGPLGKPVTASWAIVKPPVVGFGKTAVIEMARASGLALVRGKNRVMEASSYGTGQLIKAAMDRGCRTIVIGVGGTATAEGGAGALQALGLVYSDKSKRVLSSRPADLAAIDRIDWTNFDRRVRSTRIHVLCDVTNPLLGRRGSARTFGPQKGATARQVAQIEKGLARWSRFARTQTKNKPGSGAAGALAFGLSAFAGSSLVEGCSFIMKMIDWPSLAKKADLIVTGEGRLDNTSFSGKVVGEILRRSTGKKVFVLCGSTPLSLSKLKKRGIDRIETLGSNGLRHPKKALANAAKRLARKTT